MGLRLLRSGGWPSYCQSSEAARNQPATQLPCCYAAAVVVLYCTTAQQRRQLCTMVRGTVLLCALLFVICSTPFSPHLTLSPLSHCYLPLAVQPPMALWLS